MGFFCRSTFCGLAAKLPVLRRPPERDFVSGTITSLCFELACGPLGVWNAGLIHSSFIWVGSADSTCVLCQHFALHAVVCACLPDRTDGMVASGCSACLGLQSCQRPVRATCCLQWIMQSPLRCVGSVTYQDCPHSGLQEGKRGGDWMIATLTETLCGVTPCESRANKGVDWKLYSVNNCVR